MKTSGNFFVIIYVFTTGLYIYFEIKLINSLSKIFYNLELNVTKHIKCKI